MALLSVAVAVLTALVLLDLVLSAAIVRRLRETEKQLIEITTPPDTGMTPGDQMPDFLSSDGQVARSDLVGTRSLVAFFSDDCRHCPTQAERLAQRADEIAGSGLTVVSVLHVAGGSAEDLTPLLSKAGHLILENGTDELMNVFRADSTPTFLMFDDAGVLLRKGHGVDEVLDGE